MQVAAERYMKAAEAKEAAAERQWQAVEAMTRSRARALDAAPQVLPLFRSWRTPSTLQLAAATAIASGARGMSARRRVQRARVAENAVGRASTAVRGNGELGAAAASRTYQPTAVLRQMVGGLRTAPILLVHAPGGRQGEK